MSKRFCVRCGREFPASELIGGYCVDCYVKYVGVFKKRPVIELVTCPKCGSWLFRGEWREPEDINIIVRGVLVADLRKYLKGDIGLSDLEVLSVERDERSKLVARTRLHLLLNGEREAVVEEGIPIEEEHRVCPRCITRASGSHRALLQIRFEGEGPREDVIEEVANSALKRGADHIIDMEVNREGLDIKVEDVVTARKIASHITAHYGAKLIETFSSTRYDSRRGKWAGVVTISLRIPLFRGNEIVQWGDSYYIVLSASRGRLRLRDAIRGSGREVPISEYWRGALKRIGEVYYGEKAYVITGIDERAVYIVNEETGEAKEVEFLPSYADLKTGDKVFIITVKGKDILVRAE